MTKTIKRHIALQPISREHREGLSFCLKLKRGIKKKADLAEMQAYSNWFWKNQLQPHFKTEEELIFPLLNGEHPMIIKAIKDHRLIADYFSQNEPNLDILGEMAEKIHDHIRFEERKLFMEIQSSVSDERLAKIDLESKLPKSCEWINPFWE